MVEVNDVTRQQHTAPIVVGLDRDGSHDDVVLAAALNHAQYTGWAVHVVHAIPPDPVPDASSLRAATSLARHAARQARRQAITEDLQRQTAKITDQRGGQPPVNYEVRYGDPATVLLAAAQHAALLVIGTRSAGHRSPLLLGTVSQDVAVHAACPVLLIPTS